MMTRKHYEKAAKIVSTMKGNGLAAQDAAAAFVSFFADDNPRFDADRFIKACKLDAPKGWEAVNVNAA